MSIASPDEYQDGLSAGSLVRARRCWLDLLASDSLEIPQYFTFRFGCPTGRMALGLIDFLRYADFAGYVRTADRHDLPASPPWDVTGTTHARQWTLASLEHLFMDLRRAGTRYGSTLLALELLPVVTRDR